MTTIEKIRSPQYIFVIYMAVSGLLIFIFRLIFPGAEPPLAFYSKNWRFMQGALEYFNLFPALAFSALVIPFGLVSSYEEPFQSFSEMFFKKLSVSVIIAVVAAVLYVFISFFAYPVLKNREENMIYTGNLYKMAEAQMDVKINEGDWKEAAQYLAICDRIWYINDDKNKFVDKRAEINRNIDRINLEDLTKRQEQRAALSRNYRSESMSPITGDIIVDDAKDAMRMAETAFNQKRFFEAHWLANLAGRLALPGAPEEMTSARLAAAAWNEIASLAPNEQEAQRYKIFSLKMEGYKAMEAGEDGNNHEWIRAYYIFQELIELSPDDPDAKNFLAKSEAGAKQTAFFTDEMEHALGEILTGAVFSLPGLSDGRDVLRFSSLTTSDDKAYGMDLEYLSFDENSNLTASVASRYAKISPFVNNQTLILMHALDRANENISYDSEYLFGEKKPGGIILNVSYDDFLLLSEIRHGLANLQLGDLFEIAGKVGDKGYVHQIFQAEILNRIGSALFFLPMAIFIIVLGWRYRARKRPRYLFAIMLLVLPVVFNGFVFLYRSVFNTLGIWLVLSMGFAGALTIYIVVLAASVFASLIALAAQHT